MDDCFVRRVDRSGGNDLMRVRNEQAAVVGAGRMGHGIALELARGGYRVAIFDAKTGRASTAITEAERDASDLVEAGVIGQGDIPKIIQRLSAEADLKTAVTGARVVFEAVAEDLESSGKYLYNSINRPRSMRYCCLILQALGLATLLQSVANRNGSRSRIGSCHRTYCRWLKLRLAVVPVRERSLLSATFSKVLVSGRSS